MVGQPEEGTQYLERVVRELSESQSDEIGFTFGQDSLASCLVYLAFAHCALGNFSKMYDAVDLGIARSKKTGNPLTIAYVNGHFCILLSEMRDRDNLSRSIQILDHTLREHPIPNWIHALDYLRITLDSFDNCHDSIPRDAQRSLVALESMGFVYWRPIFEANLARIRLARGETALAEQSIAHGTALIKSGCDSWGGPELARVDADVMKASNASPEAIEDSYRLALEAARAYPNKLYELRTACGLARYWIDKGRPEAAAKLLRTVSESVTEPREIHDLLEAKALLSQLTI